MDCLRQRKDMGSSTIFRVLLQVTDLDRSQQFYESLLGQPGRKVGGGRVYFDCGTVILAIVDPSAEGEARAVALPEPLYLATGDLEGVYRRANALGCLSSALIHDDPANPAGEIVVRPWGERSFYGADPSGNPICFVDSRTSFTGTSPRSVSGGRNRPKSRRTPVSRHTRSHRSPARVRRKRR
jgi:catechol 2,3-dioxygenase-like lactoylglutathione lyase family enzyme